MNRAKLKPGNVDSGRVMLILNHPELEKCFLASLSMNWRVKRNPKRGKGGKQLYTIEKWLGGERVLNEVYETAWLFDLIQHLEQRMNTTVQICKVTDGMIDRVDRDPSPLSPFSRRKAA